MSVQWVASAATPTAAQVLLTAEVAMLLTAMGGLVTIERALADAGRARGWLGGLRWMAGATAPLSAAIGVIALVSGHLAGWEKTLISCSLVLLLGVICLSYLSLVRARETSPVVVRLWSVAAGTLLAVAVTSAFVAVDAEPTIAGESVTFPVYGTCLSGGCGLKQRAGPGPQYREAGPRLRDGTEVTIVCRVHGDPVPGHRSPWWDRLPSGTYVSDAFIDRPKDGRPPYIELCDPDDYDL